MNASIGRIASIWRFPIKSFQGESIARTSLSASGIFGDRVLALRDIETGKIVSAKNAKLSERILALEARYEREPVPGQALPNVRAQVGERELSTADPAAFAEACSAALGHAVELAAPAAADDTYASDWPEIEGLPLAGASIDLPLPLAAEGSFADLEPLHILTTASLARLAQLAADSRIEVGRFRPSLVVDTGEAEGFVENEWCGRTATLGKAKLELGGSAPRCIMTTRAQAGLPRDASVLKTLVAENRRDFMGMMMPCLGIYAKVSEPGEIAVGDAFSLD